MNRPPAEPHIVIVGGGFGGLRAARALRRAPVRITLVDRHNYHLFQPLLYQVATAGLSPHQIAHPIRSILRRQKNARVIMADALAVDPAARRLRLNDGDLVYDTLILATGATHSYFGNESWEPLAPGLKTLDDALEMRQRILLAFERAEAEDDPARQDMLLTFVVVGAGPTGVELAGSIAELARTVMVRDFRRIDPATAKIVLVEAGPRVLATYPESLSEKAEASLRRLGVTVRTNSMVTAIEPELVRIGDETIAAGTVLWGAGVKASPLAESLGVPLDRAGRVRVEPDLTVPGRPEIFVIGDLAYLEDSTGEPLPGVAPAALQQGEYAGRSIQRRLQGKPVKPFRYIDRGSMATVGRAAAVAEMGRVKLHGLIAWLAWLFIHVVMLIDFRSRLIVTIEWAWAYLSFQRAARLITHVEPAGAADQTKEPGSRAGGGAG